MSARRDWETIRAEYEAGASQSDLARRHGVSRKAIQKHIAAEGWAQDVSGTLNRMAEAKVAGLVAGCDPKKRAEVLGRAADARAAVITGQREAWEGFENQVNDALAESDFDRLKCLKIASEALRNAQECQRRAWGIRDASEDRAPVAASVVVDLSGATPAQISDLVDAAWKEPGNAC